MVRVAWARTDIFILDTVDKTEMNLARLLSMIKV